MAKTTEEPLNPADLYKYQDKDPDFTLEVEYTNGNRVVSPYHTAAQVAFVPDMGILRLDTLEGSFFFVLANVSSWALRENFPEKVTDRVIDDEAGILRIKGQG